MKCSILLSVHSMLWSINTLDVYFYSRIQFFSRSNIGCAYLPLTIFDKIRYQYVDSYLCACALLKVHGLGWMNVKGIYKAIFYWIDLISSFENYYRTFVPLIRENMNHQKADEICLLSTNIFADYMVEFGLKSDLFITTTKLLYRDERVFREGD